MLETNFPGQSRSETQELDDWTTRIPVPRTLEDISTAQRGTSPGMIALALLADPLRMYRQVISVHPDSASPNFTGLQPRTSSLNSLPGETLSSTFRTRG